VIGHRLQQYQIVEKLGEGGTGTVYRAQDSRLRRMVALKVLPAWAGGGGQQRERLLREARLASALNHPNIVSIYEVGAENGLDYIAMEMVEGKTLGALIPAGGLPAGKAVEYAVQIAAGLAKAHAAGVIHRDLKPGNVMVTGDELVKLLDFGLARRVQLDRRDDATLSLTMQGETLGTPAYMSPEQAEGKALDARTDIFSFGALLYELLSGQRAFRRETLGATIAAVMLLEPPPLGGHVPPELRRIVERCLKKKPGDRFSDAGELKRALEEAAVAPAPAPSIAVLPFANLSADKENEYFSDGLAEDILDALAKLPGLRVIARTSAFAFRGAGVDVREIGAKLAVGHVMEGSVRRAGTRIRVTAQLIDTADGSHLWSERYDREMTDVFAIQDDISQAIVEKLRVRLTGDKPLVKRHTENVEAYNLFLRGRHLVTRMTPESLAKGRECLEAAITLDPEYALAQTGMAEYHLVTTFWGFRDPLESLPLVKQAATAAVRLDDTSSEAHSALGSAMACWEFDWAGAEHEARRALELNPGSSIAHYFYGFTCLRPTGRLEAGRAHIRQALKADPLSPLYNALLGYFDYLLRQSGEAIAQYRRAADLAPGWFFPQFLLSSAYAFMGRIEEALDYARTAHELSGRNALTTGHLASICGYAGLRQEAEVLLAELLALGRSGYLPPFAMVAAYSGLGEMKEVFEWLEKGIEGRDTILVTGLKTELRYERLREHPRYQALLRKMNLAG
jgi:serine/threonine-protein kinase